MKKASDKTIGVSIVFHNAFGWHIHQNRDDKGDNQVTDYLLGNSINVAYIIITYMLNQTPSVTHPNYGLGHSTSLEISIIQTSIQINTNTINKGIFIGSNAPIIFIVISTHFVLL